MTIAYWVFIGIIVVACLFGAKSLISFVLASWAEYGGKFAVLLGILIILLITPGIMKFVYPEYYGVSIWVFILYAVGLIAYRNLIKTDKEG